ncbi:hypothetical protein PV341_19890 [Streptomyces sp. PA03-1a]|nr:hypothetical protein [Streptomyces sp. PA03-1a]
MKRNIAAILTTLTLSVTAFLGLAAPAQAATGPSCSDAYQIGSTGYITLDGMTAASVKQYYSPSCNRNYGYVFVWQQFRDAHPSWYVSTGVLVTSEQYVYAAAGADNAIEIWSGAASTANKCTEGYGYLRLTGTNNATGHSSERC